VVPDNCDEGRSPLNPAQPQGITAQEVIEKFAAKEAIFKQARNNYTYTQDITGTDRTILLFFGGR